MYPRFIYIILIGFCCLHVAYSGEYYWKVSNVKKLFNTPIGSVYKFPLSPDCIFYLGHSGKTNIERCQCSICNVLTDIVNAGVEINLEAPKTKKKQTRKRFLIMEFKIRAFPALSNKISDFSFEVVFSKNKIIGNPIYSIDSVIKIRSDRWMFDYASRVDGFARWKNDTATRNWWYNWNFHSDFDPYSIRIIYDQVTGNIGLDINDYLIIREWENGSNNRKNIFSKIKYIAIITAHRPGEENLRTDLLEISSPQIYYCNTENEILNLEKNHFAQYPYDQYYIIYNKQNTSVDDFFERIKKEKNPDIQYAYAMRFLYAQDTLFNPTLAIKLLRKAADKNHVLALYDLGLCYYRGYGVAPDYNKAERYLKKAESFYYEKAAALLLYMHWDIQKRKIFLNHDFYNNIHHFYKRYYKDYHLFEHDFDFVYNFFVGGNILTPMLSSKHLLFPNTLTFESKKQRNPIQFFRSKSDIHSLLYELNHGGKINISPLVLDQIAVETMGTDIFPMFLYHLYRQNRLVEFANVFSPQKDFYYSDSPLYLFIKYCHSNGLKLDLPLNANDIVRMNEVKFPASGRTYLSALSYLSALTFPSRTTEESRNDIGRKFFLKINECTYENRDAAYLLGKFYFYNDLPKDIKDKFSKNHTTLAAKYLSLAAKKGHPKAKLLLAELDISTIPTINSSNLSLKKQFDFLRRIDLGLYYRYLGLVLQKKRISDQAHAMFLKATQYGDFASFLPLALSEKNPANEKKYWQEWIKHDILNRKKDMLDPFSDFIYAEYDKWAIKPYFISVDQQSENFRKFSMEKFNSKVRVLSNVVNKIPTESKLSKSKRKNKIKFRKPSE